MSHGRGRRAAAPGDSPPPGGPAVSDIVRFTVSVEDDLLHEFDHYCEAERLANRSEAVRQLIREKLTLRAAEAGAGDVSASLTVVYDHHDTGLHNRMIGLQHDHHERVVSTMHVHLDHDFCMEVIVLRGPADQLRRLAAELSGLRGILRSQLVIARASGGGRKHVH
jgi:CopG family transcriptional regulator, nickel-responsive regulator